MFVFLLAYRADSLNSNQLLFEMAKYNFSNFMVRNFDITVDADNGISRMLISGFLNYDEALQYARQLYADATMAERLKGCRRIIISEENLKMLGTRYSYVEYEDFFEKSFVPLLISNEELLNIPDGVETPEGDVTLPGGIDIPAAPAEQTAPADEDDGLGLGDLPVTPAEQTTPAEEDDELGLGDLPVAPAEQTAPAEEDDELGLGGAPEAPAQQPAEDNNSINNEPPAGGFDFDDDFYR